MVIARNLTELKYLDEAINSKKQRWCIAHKSMFRNYEIPRQETLKKWI